MFSNNNSNSENVKNIIFFYFCLSNLRPEHVTEKETIRQDISFSFSFYVRSKIPCIFLHIVITFRIDCLMATIIFIVRIHVYIRLWTKEYFQYFTMFFMYALLPQNTELTRGPPPSQFSTFVYRGSSHRRKGAACPKLLRFG